MPSEVDLGYVALCLNATDVEKTAAFYKTLGFLSGDPNDVSGVREIVQFGSTVFTFMNFLESPCLNYRGASMHAVATELEKRNFKILGQNEGGQVELMLDKDGNPLPDNECGHFTLLDPDGHKLFFNTHPPERAPYMEQAWEGNYEALAEEIDRAKNHEIALGQFICGLGTKDMAGSNLFYGNLGFIVLDSSEKHITVGHNHPHTMSHPGMFPLRLLQTTVGGFHLLFSCEDPEEAASAIRGKGIKIASGPDGPEFADPDGRRVVLLQAPTEN